ncbi:TnsA endonuclease N-terminal domain-containing protein [Thalassospira xiamenensis]|uniref:TnsA endonuclease N-terminal domain-containing protein n=1 Tax=Thalassospira xiamenensis TaxID=220697 RepID=UPI0007A4A519|nr:TnsA endonuclease N-terminal domain-containing protein [Thalassospira xiamenensis]KZB53024.1 hypothetical protein AUP41_03030 [Thalassospira xiamenensis]
MNKNKDLWDNWLSKRETAQQNAGLRENFSAAEQMFEQVTTFMQETFGSREIRPGVRSVTGLAKVAPDIPQIPFESTLERDFVFLAAGRPSVHVIESQPVTIRYFDEFQKEMVYTPDYLVVYHLPGPNSAGHKLVTLLVEIKYLEDLNGPDGPKLMSKFSHAKRWAELRGWNFAVFTEDEIRTAELERTRMLTPYRFEPSIDRLQFEIDLLIRSRGDVTIGEMLSNDFSNYTETQVRKEILRMLATNQVYSDPLEPISEETIVKSWYVSKSL